MGLHRVDICDPVALRAAFKASDPLDCVVHLAAQAGVRYSVDNPVSVIHTNISGTQVVFDTAREFKVPYIVAASSSSVYGASSTVPFSEDQACNQPVSPYAATKRSNELFAFAFNHLHKIPITMLRFSRSMVQGVDRIWQPSNLLTRFRRGRKLRSTAMGA